MQSSRWREMFAFHSNELFTKPVFIHEYCHEHRKQQTSLRCKHNHSLHAAERTTSTTILLPQMLQRILGATSAGKAGDLHSCCIEPHRQKPEALSLCLLPISFFLNFFVCPLWKSFPCCSHLLQVHCKRKKKHTNKKTSPPTVILGVHVFLLLDFCFCLRR